MTGDTFTSSRSGDQVPMVDYSRPEEGSEGVKPEDDPNPPQEETDAHS